MMVEPIFVTGAGIVSAIGVGKAETLASLKASKTGIGPMKYLSSIHSDLPVGEVKLSNAEMMQMLNVADDSQLSRTVLMGRIALREALDEARLTGDQLRRAAFISATTVGGMDRRELFYAQEKDCDALHAAIATQGCGSSTERIAEPFGSFAMLSTVSTACSSATNAIVTGANMLRCGLTDIVVVGGSECLSMFHLNGFNTLMILDSQQCRPFDRDRAGLNLGEGAAYLVLETKRSVRRRSVKPLCRLSGYGNACDAFHQTASSPDGEGAYLAMQEALHEAGLMPGDIQYINAHGTGTPNNDESESRAIKRVFGDHVPPVSSTKSFTGHTTSASGSIEAIFCILAMQHQFLPQNLNWHTPMDEGIIPVISQQTEHVCEALAKNIDAPAKVIRHILSNAFGFGGNDSSLVLSKCDA
jgi:3-oxoacyl-[acyl-carrier-protein] synthase-1